MPIAAIIRLFLLNIELHAYLLDSLYISFCRLLSFHCYSLITCVCVCVLDMSSPSLLPPFPFQPSTNRLANWFVAIYHRRPDSPRPKPSPPYRTGAVRRAVDGVQHHHCPQPPSATRTVAELSDHPHRTTCVGDPYDGCAAAGIGSILGEGGSTRPL